MEGDAITRRLGPQRIAGELLRRYETSGPRYTSYPTAPQFTADLDRDEVIRRWGASNEAGSSAPSALSVYVHVPFCKSRCAYCGCFTKVGADEETLSAYVDAILANADWVGGFLSRERPLEQLALGGGTPTYLPPTLMTRLVQGIGARFAFAPDGERAIEVDPRRVDTAYLDVLVDLGFNRFSFGVQDLDPAVQRTVNRVLPYEKLESLLSHLRGRGVEAVNLDLIYGLPGQSPASYEATLRKVIELRPSRVATFGYAHVPWVSPHQEVLADAGLPSARERMELFGLAYDMFLDAGWRHVGMDHFALPTDELVLALESRTLTRNFMGYTTRKGLDLVPLGVSAIGAVASTYVQNTKALGDYVAARGSERWVRGFLMSPEDLLRREVILELLCNFHLDKESVAARHGVDFDRHFARELDELERFERDELLSVVDGAIHVTDLGRFFIRNIAMTFDEYLRTEDDGSQRYSRTV